MIFLGGIEYIVRVTQVRIDLKFQTKVKYIDCTISCFRHHLSCHYIVERAEHIVHLNSWFDKTNTGMSGSHLSSSNWACQ